MPSSATLTVLGLLAGALTSFSFALQVWQSWRTKSVKDVSAGMYLVFSTGVILWLIYGLLRRDIPLMVWNTLTLVLVATILVLKFRYGRRRPTTSAQRGTPD
ncbi:SemiSWEET family sugar transporter [Chloracidobacterium thermophilum]|uniref:Uncharacterized conserved protein n=1 Tax=Chloracidobacterium thermophilum (strain B) TaxID=981222 RepID=G2LHS6_CHLTF|nr:SemiSWEET transporter [Chloracidobacterium thermophilum]AEP10986.1 Uncharacterized conserved protein [Chloracidobacterium thermophilum B]QUV78912.1 SemiSWEET family sugar transporter [Chloracidobacterium thermophilum]